MYGPCLPRSPPQLNCCPWLPAPYLAARAVVAPFLAGVHATVQQLATGAPTQGGLLITLEVGVQGLATGTVPLALLGAASTGS
jgi:hypothetical protein